MALFLVFLAIPIAWLVFAKIVLHSKITWKEAGVQFGISIVVAALITIALYIGKNMGGMDTELINGFVEDKYNQRVSCAHSYECNCTYYKDSNGNSQRRCQTCYEHPFDVSWIVDTTVGDISISRVNSQGTIEPPRFTEVEINEPVTRRNSYMNYVKANPDSIFNDTEHTHLMNTHEFNIPNYPVIHDVYRVNRVVVASHQIPRDLFRDLSESISMELRTLSAEKEVNIVVVVTHESNPQYANALKYEWLGGKKNDVIIVLGMPEYPNIEWIESFGWAEGSRIFNEINDHYRGQELNVDTFATDLSAIIREHYVRQEFSQYDYLLDELSPPLWAIFIGFIINLIVCVSVGWYFYKHDPLD